jgi:uncharacterized protein involved in response to NO
MMEGFELGFVAGFALTVLPRFTRTPPVGPRLVLAQQGLALAFGVGWAVGRPAVAHAAFLASLLLLALVAVDRLRRRQNDPPEEASFLFGGIAFGLVGAGLLTAQALGLWADPSPRFASRLLSLGMVLAMVLGMGGLLVPVFLGIKDPLVIPRVARPHERPARRMLYAGALIALAGSFAADAFGLSALGAWARAAVAAVMILGVWKTWRRPRAWSGPAALLWVSGWCVLAGLVGAAVAPLHATALLHLALIGGYGALTLGIATRVVVTHGGHAVDRERAVLPVGLAVGLGIVLALRLAAEAAPEHALPLYAMSAVSWIAVWTWWLARAFGPTFVRALRPAAGGSKPGRSSP